ncbi:MAG: hypothetical protein LBH75_00045 [Treponema sp.]|nr:hypothetical protein [Treponema sp.]
MKKLIAISLVLTFVAGAAFAEVTVGGSAVGRWQIISDTTQAGQGQKDVGENSKIYADTIFGAENGGVGNSVRGRVSVSAANEDGTFGASVSIRVQRDGAIDSSVGTGAWWKPLDILKVTFGYMWGGGSPIGVALVDDDILTPAFYGRGANYIAWGYEIEQGAHIELTPIEGLYILATVPLYNKGSLQFNTWNTPFVAGTVRAERIFQHTSARIAYTIADIGTIRATFWGGTGMVVDTPSQTSVSLGDADASVLDVGFALTAIENLGIDIGFELPFAATYWLDDPAYPGATDLNYQVPMSVNLRVNFNAGAFHLAGGVAASFAGKSSLKVGGAEMSFEQGLDLGVTLNPAFDIGDLLTVGLVGEFKLDGEDTKKAGAVETKNASATHFVVLPYIQKNVNGATLYAGIRIADKNSYKTGTDGTTNELDKSGIAWSIPVGFTYYF